MDFEYFWRTEATDHLGSNLKDDLCDQPFTSHIKHAEVRVRAFDGLRKEFRCYGGLWWA